MSPTAIRKSMFYSLNIKCDDWFRQTLTEMDVATGGVKSGWSPPGKSNMSLEHIISRSLDDTSIEVRLPVPDTSLSSQGPEYRSSF